MAAAKKRSQPSANIAIALQGGGTHAAFSWGAVSHLLEEPNIHIKAITGTSAGALNAVVLAHGLVTGGRLGAVEALQTLWKKISVAASLLPFKPTIVDNMLSNVGLNFTASSMALDYFTKLFSPYQFNLIDFNPLKAIVEEMVDFDYLNKQKQLKIFINATHVPSGKCRIFSNGELSLDAVMAAGCLPYIFRTVYIDDAPYWDGAYSANPALRPLAQHCPELDVVIIETTPLLVEEVPTKSTDILDRATELSFTTSLRGELEWMALLNQAVGNANAMRFHMIESQELLANLGRASKLNTEHDFLVYLHDLGVQTAEDWLKANGDMLGKKSTLSLES